MSRNLSVWTYVGGRLSRPFLTYFDGRWSLVVGRLWLRKCRCPWIDYLLYDSSAILFNDMFFLVLDNCPWQGTVESFWRSHDVEVSTVITRHVRFLSHTSIRAPICDGSLPYVTKIIVSTKIFLDIN
jgi:hypothetical protein